jgi:hypothetical protein
MEKIDYRLSDVVGSQHRVHCSRLNRRERHIRESTATWILRNHVAAGSSDLCYAARTVGKATAQNDGDDPVSEHSGRGVEEPIR